MDYTLLNIERYSNVSIFRIVDEIYAAIDNIKNFLKKEGFDDKKLELCIFGASASAHLSLLYSYFIKNSPIPVKFVINIFGPVTLEYQYWFSVINLTEPLDSIEQESIEKAKNENKIEKLNLKMPLTYLNIWNGLDKSADSDQLYDPQNNEINTDNELYKERFEKGKFGFPIRYVEKDSIPTLCFYGGKDVDVGIGHYSLLKSYFDKKENRNIELIYVQNASHNLMNDPPEVYEQLMNEFYSKLLNYSNKYFSKD